MNESYIGIDLAWSTRHQTGLAALRPGHDGLEVVASETRSADDDVVAFVGEHLADRTIVMVDAPLFVPNASQMRECDRETHRRYGRFQAGAYPANRTNLSRYYGDRPRGEALRERLMRYGFPAAACSLPPPAVATRLVFECYPHPAHIVLFGLRLTLKYKKKRQTWDQARSEFRRYLRLMRGLEDPRLDLRQDLLRELDPGDDVGKRYKEKEDRLDAIFGAYLSALVPTGWVEMIGQPEDGGMVVPLPRLARLVYLHHQR